MSKRGESWWFLGILVVVLFFGFCVENSFSKITKKHDDFSGKTIYKSKSSPKPMNKVGPWRDVQLIIHAKENKMKSFIAFWLLKKDLKMYSREGLLMKIDGELTEMDYLKTQHETFNTGHILSVGGYLLERQDIKKIINANNITIRVYMQDASKITWEVPDKVLNEWKEVIERSGVLK